MSKLSQRLELVSFVWKLLLRVGKWEILVIVLAPIPMAIVTALQVSAGKHITDEWSRIGAPNGAVMMWVFIIVASWAIRNFCNIGRTSQEEKLSIKFEEASEAICLNKLARLPLASLENAEVRGLIFLYQRKSHTMLNALRMGSDFLAQIGDLVGLAWLVWYMPWQVSLVLLVVFTIRFVYSTTLSSNILRLNQMEKREQRRAQYFARSLADIQKLSTMKTFRLEQPFIQKWKSYVGEVVNENIKESWHFQKGRFVLQSIDIAGFAIALYLLVSLQVPLSIYVIFMTNFTLITMTLGMAGRVFRILKRDVSYFPDFKRLLELPEEPVGGKHVTRKPLQITFDHVSFAYPGADKPVLNDVSFTFNEGDHLAIVGLNGAGKSTLLSLLKRVYEPTSGAILINGKPLQSIDLDEWRKALSFMAQSTPAFDDILSEQIHYGQYDRPLNKSRLEEATQVSGLDLIADELPKGLQSHAGRAFAMPEDNALELSGGQNQIVAITRALYRDARFYIFDEPTSAVDAEKEERFFEKLPDMLQGRGLIFVSHRFSTLRRAQRILVLDQGHIIEDGSHEELIAKQGRYAELFTLQAKSYQ